MSTPKETASAGKNGISQVPPEQLAALQQFIEKLGGIEKAKLAIETLAKIRKAA